MEIEVFEEMSADMFENGNWMVAWTPMGKPQHGEAKPGSIEVGPWPDKTGWSDRYPFTTGCCELPRLDWTEKQRAFQLLLDFHTIVVHDGIDPRKAHVEFMKIDDYRERISPELAREKSI